MIPQPFPPFPFPPFPPSPFSPFLLFFLRLFLRTPVSSALASVWLHLVYKSFFPYISYTSTHCGVPTVPSIPFRTAEAPPVYQPCPPSSSVPQKPLLCTNRVLHPVPYRRSPSRVPTVSLHPVPYRRSPSRVPTVSLIPFRTAEAPPVYQPCPPSRSVPQKPLLCTYYAPYLVLCRESTFLNRTLLTIFRRMTVICFCLHLMEIMSPLRTVSNQACDGSARWMNGSRSGVFGPDPTSEPCLNLSRHLARSRTL